MTKIHKNTHGFIVIQVDKTRRTQIKNNGFHKCYFNTMKRHIKPMFDNILRTLFILIAFCVQRNWNSCTLLWPGELDPPHSKLRLSY